MLYNLVFRKDRPPHCHFAAVTDFPLRLMIISERDQTLLVLAAESPCFIPTGDSERRLREETSLRNAFSPAASGTAQKRHPGEKLLPLPRSISASSQAQPSGLAIALKAFCKKEAAWPEGTHYRTTPAARIQSPSCSSKIACSQSRRCAYTPPRPLLPHC